MLSEEEKRKRKADSAARHYAKPEVRARVLASVRAYAGRPEVLKREKVRSRNRYLENKDEYRDRNLRRKYGITIAQFDQLLAEQNGACAICETKTPGGRGAFHVDHDHATGHVRGLLCHGCNLAIGNLKDDPRVAESAAAYLRRARIN